MMKYPIRTAHGHSHSELEHILEDSCDAFDDFINLDHTSMGGWSNINIRGRSSGIEFVLKLPWSTELYEINPYDQLFNLSHYYNKLDLAASPIAVGRLPDFLETPYYIVEYIEGVTHSSLTNASEEELLSLKESHQTLKRENPPNIPKYQSPLSYLNAIRSLVEEHNWLKKASTDIRNLLYQYESLLPRVFSLIENIGYWSGETMHGDFWIPNIIFRPKRKALFLDFEACANGDYRYDLAYLIEAHDNQIIEKIPVLFEGEDVDFIYSLRPLVLSCVIDWSIARLLSMESGIVEQNLNTKRIYSMILNYSQQKISRLRSLLH